MTVTNKNCRISDFAFSKIIADRIAFAIFTFQKYFASRH